MLYVFYDCSLYSLFSDQIVKTAMIVLLTNIYKHLLTIVFCVWFFYFFLQFQPRRDFPSNAYKQDLFLRGL